MARYTPTTRFFAHGSRLTAYGSRAFTLVELLVAVAIMAIVLGAMGVIFRMSMDAYRASSATAEVMRKLRAVTEQLNMDFKGMRKDDGIIFLVWTVQDPDIARVAPYILDGRPRYTREDRIIFFANGDFQSYRDQPPAAAGAKQVRGNVARISYMVARDKYNDQWYWPDDYGAIDIWQPGQTAQRELRRRTRILARSQHIVSADAGLTAAAAAFPDFSTIDTKLTSVAEANEFCARNSSIEYDTDGLQGWAGAPAILPPVPITGDLYAMLSVGTGITIASNGIGNGGLRVNPDRPDLPESGVHQMLVEGVRDFKIQGWFYDDLTGRYRWFPETGTVNSAGNIVGTDFFTYTAPDGKLAIDTPGALGVLLIDGVPDVVIEMGPKYPGPSYVFNYPGGLVGLGKALKFTFTLYDSRGFFKDGLTFTHIVYMGDN